LGKTATQQITYRLIGHSQHLLLTPSAVPGKASIVYKILGGSIYTVSHKNCTLLYNKFAKLCFSLIILAGRYTNEFLIIYAFDILYIIKNRDQLKIAGDVYTFQ